METVLHYRKMLLNPRYGTVGLLGVPFFLLSEVIAPVFEVLALLGIIGGFAAGAFPLGTSLLMVAAIAFANAIFTTAAVLLEDRTSRAYGLRDLLRVIVLGPLDLVVYRPLVVFARVKGTWRFLRRDTDWHKFERNARPAPSS
jgi:poly-beta-1,6-N-acetyl-D-glucosamine synthase